MTTFEDVIVSGKVGIGTTSPSTKLHVVGLGTPQMSLRPVPVALIENAGSAKIEFRDTKRGQGWRVGTGDGGYCISESSEALLQTDYLVIQKGTGNIGIGTTSPSNKLHVVGAGPVTIENAGEADILFKDTTHDQAWEVGTNENGWYVFDTTKSTYDLVVQKGSGNVGVGINKPEFKMDVGGAIRAISKAQNTAVLGVAEAGIGLHAISEQGIALQAEAPKATAVYATSTEGYGVHGASEKNIAVYGVSTSNVGVRGESTNNFGVHGVSANNIAV